MTWCFFCVGSRIRMSTPFGIEIGAEPILENALGEEEKKRVWTRRAKAGSRKSGSIMVIALAC